MKADHQLISVSYKFHLSFSRHMNYYECEQIYENLEDNTINWLETLLMNLMIDATE